MPHINRIRVNNVRYNFGTQYYDDFLMRFSGKNTIYDLANGGGKSVLMLLLLQNMIPNCTLDEKQPIEKLFRTNNGSTTIHSLVEWRLSDAHIKDNYKYMLTGFCARKAKENPEDKVKDTANIEYFNYCIFYREFNDNDIKNLPLKNGNERITYNGLKNYLRELEKRDLSLKIYIFERKGEYQRFIADYGIYESEWEIIRGINKTEGHVRTYFESNYKTTRKVVEDLLIEEIIQKSFNSKTYSEDREDEMAKTLVEIKDKLVSLLKAKEDINNYDRQAEVIGDFAKRVDSVKELYYGKENLADEIVRSYYTIGEMLENVEKDKQANEGEIEKITKVIDDYKRDIESAQVVGETCKLSEYIDKLTALEAALKEKTDQNNNAKKELAIKESINDYADYLYYKRERDSLSVAVDNMLSDKADLIEELRELAAVKFSRNKEKMAEILSEIEKLEGIIAAEEESIKQLATEDKAIEKQIAVEEYLGNAARENLDLLLVQINEKRKEYNGILSFDFSNDEKQLQDKNNQLVEKSSKLTEEQKAVKENISKLKEEEVKIKEDILDNDDRLSLCIDEKNQVMSILEKAEKLSKVYGERNFNVLKELIDLKINEAIEEQTSLEEQEKELSVYMKGLENKTIVPANGQLKGVFEYIVRYYGNIAVLGAELVKALTKEECKEVLEYNPLLPYSIVVKDKYDLIISDTALKELCNFGAPIPVIRYEAIKENTFCVDYNNLDFIRSDEEIFYNEELLEKRKIKLNEELSAITFKKEQIEETLDLLRKDALFVKNYVEKEKARCEAVQTEYEELKSQRKAMEGKSEELRVEIAEKEKSLLVISEELEQTNRYIACLNQDMEIISQLVGMSKKQEELSEDEAVCKTRLRDLSVKYDTLSKRLEAKQAQLAGRKNNVLKLKEDMEEIKNKWQDIYKSYYKEGIIANSVMPDSELEARFLGLKKVCEENLTDVSDKQKLINNYDVAMEKALIAIDYNGVDTKEIQEYYESGKYTTTDKEQLKTIKRDISVKEEAILELQRNISHIKSEKDRTEGGIEKSKEKIVEKYGKFVEPSLEGANIVDYIGSKKDEILKNEALLSGVRNILKNIEKNNQKYIILQRDIDKIITNAKINVGTAKKLLSGVGDLEERIAQVVEKNDKFLKEMYDKREQFEKEKQMLIDLLVQMNSHALADEMRSNIILPEGIDEADRLINALKEIVDCIMLERERVLKSIEDMEKIKDNFENQCIQTCINIKNELDRLPKLSKINMDGETISIISLTIPYIKEEQYKLSMEKYIDDTVSVADSMRNETERLKYIRNQLSFKRLFSAIVKDMNGIKLSLYKRERIKEQSRYLKYEEAVGSTGQSQGIYIQFLIAIINYISSINSKGSEGALLKKAIFIDNPFGAAKDIYIWEPIFKLLKTNCVQLIVPARGTTPAITGRFDVNYILGQKLIDGKQQTVVVDYCSNVDNEQMEYETLTYEQTALF